MIYASRLTLGSLSMDLLHLLAVGDSWIGYSSCIAIVPVSLYIRDMCHLRVYSMKLIVVASLIGT
jgi:hypothetical protein